MTLKDLRKQAGLTQLELGCKVGVTSSAIVQYEKYKRVPDIFVIVKLSKALEVPIETVVQAIIDNDNEDLH